MTDLANHYNRGLVLLKDIAQRQDVSERYLEHLFLSLKAAGLVKSVRGARGGFILARPPSETKLIDILRVSEGPMAVVECIAAPETCPRSVRCSTRDVWAELQDAMDGVLGSLTLADLVSRQNAKDEKTANMYVI